jgi:hypothetical protein
MLKDVKPFVVVPNLGQVREAELPEQGGSVANA